MEKLINLTAQDFFYAYALIYILDCIISIIKRIINKKENIKVDVTNLDEIQSLSKKRFFKISYLIFPLTLAWIIIGINDYENFLEKFYFIILLVAGIIMPLLFGIPSAIKEYNKVKNSENKTIDVDEMSNRPEVKRQKVFYSLLNLFEILIVILILNNHLHLI